MKKKELIDRLKNIPDDTEIRILERGACYDWGPLNVLYKKEEEKVYIRNFTNKQLKKSSWC